MVIARFYTVGLACALLHNAIMIGGDWIGLHYVISNVVSFGAVGAFGYLLHTWWTFPGAVRGGASFFRYLLGMAANLPLSLAGMLVFVDVAGLPVSVAAPVVTVLLAAYNYFAGRWALLRAEKGASSRQT
jgi:putative flippase GtrA